MKLVVREAETSQLTAFLTGRGAQVATSALAVVEVLRAVRIAEPGADGTRRAIRRLDEAVSYTSAQVGAVDAVHLAGARRIGAREILVYDRRLAEAASSIGLDVLSPGA